MLNHIKEQIDNLNKCATCWHEEDVDVTVNGTSALMPVLTLDFYVDKGTKRAFQQYFTTSFEFFRFFQVLYELNAHFISESIKEDVYRSKGFYTDGKVPIGSPDQNVFYFLEYRVLKNVDGESEPKELLLREFSDGEHQFLHTMGICLMLKERRSVLLLDEPETHFNPNWRSKFIKILDDSITAGNGNENVNGSFNVHLLKDAILTSHSP
jgi:restriction system-associated AAA family ATPase